MTRFSLASLRVRLLLLVLLAVLPALGLILYTAADQRRHAAATAQAEALRLARLTAGEQEELADSARQLLVVLAQLPVVRDRDGAACSALFADLLRQYHRYANLGAATPDGEVYCSALPLGGPVNLADRAYIQRALQARGFAIGDYQIGRITNRATVNFGYPVLAANGQPQAVVYAALDLAWLNELAAEAELPPDSTLTMIDRNGLILVRYPDGERWVGAAVPEAPLVQALRRERGAGTAQLPGLDGLVRLYAFAPVGAPEAGVSVSVGIPTAAALAAADRALARNLVALGLVAALALAAAWIGGDLFLLRQVRALVGATRRLAAGDLSARTGVRAGQGELNHLAHTFDRMAETLQRRQAEVEQATEALRRAHDELELRVQERTAELARLSHQFRLILNAAGEGIQGLDRQGHATFVNPAAARLTGYEVDELTGRRLHDLLAPAQADGTPYPWEESPVYATLRDGVVRHVTDAVLRRKDGTVFPVEYLSTPIREAGAIVGAVVLFQDITERREVERLKDERRRQLEEELARAAQVQAALLPRDAPALPGFELAARCLPAREVGGDFFDWHEPAPGHLTLTLGDVMGKGMSAALLMATARAALEAVARHSAPAAAIQTVAAALERDLESSGSFITLFHAQADITTRCLEYVDAGHGHVFLYRADGQVEELRARGLPLGVFPEHSYVQGATALAPGDALVVYSDGLIDARPDAALDRATFAGHLGGATSAVEIVDRLVALAVPDDGALPDDLTVVVLRCRETS